MMASSASSNVPPSLSIKNASDCLPKPSPHPQKPKRSRRKKRDNKDFNLQVPSRDQFIQMAGVIAVALLVAASLNRAVKWSSLYFGRFCDSESESDSSYQHPSQSCTPCPENGICQNGKLQCAAGFKRHGKYCRENSQLDKKSKELAKWMEGFICGLHARSLCNGAGVFWRHEEELRQELENELLKSAVNMNPVEVAVLKEKTMDIIYQLLERTSLLDGSHRFKCPDMLAEQYKSLGCRTREWISSHYIFCLMFTIIMFTSGRRLCWWYSRRKTIDRAEKLYQRVCEILEEKAITERSKGDRGELWVVATLLRDHLLLPRERKNVALWKQVEEYIQGDTRINQYPKVVKGECKIVLEWQVEGALQLRKSLRDGDTGLSCSDTGAKV